MLMPLGGNSWSCMGDAVSKQHALEEPDIQSSICWLLLRSGVSADSCTCGDRKAQAANMTSSCLVSLPQPFKHCQRMHNRNELSVAMDVP